MKQPHVGAKFAYLRGGAPWGGGDMTDFGKKLAELIEINLMFAQLELSIGVEHDGATLRALNHIIEALDLIREEKTHKQSNILGDSVEFA
ncbi:hypothetical protein CCR94_10510 [Rhodoblastus sphagnicola]|uniref:Uncharacterized protein n=1 Tax=Rhodoblastus sphagnicola TaxID=333368 RepID=A0A2S6N8S5_9HYPH|nr:hypothetical protein [Rhodoblastus sphagnicola]MBB4200968.1 hypothetical protein [Rhodoblastus sphagnicola]PPQ31022.1 hypothetical protein CCR94_10510 [Rhodoblastus sphagnicola]